MKKLVCGVLLCSFLSVGSWVCGPKLYMRRRAANCLRMVPGGVVVFRLLGVLRAQAFDSFL